MPTQAQSAHAHLKHRLHCHHFTRDSLYGISQYMHGVLSSADFCGAVVGGVFVLLHRFRWGWAVFCASLLPRLLVVMTFLGSTVFSVPSFDACRQYVRFGFLLARLSFTKSIGLCDLLVKWKLTARHFVALLSLVGILHKSKKEHPDSCWRSTCDCVLDVCAEFWTIISTSDWRMADTLSVSGMAASSGTNNWEGSTQAEATCSDFSLNGCCCPINSLVTGGSWSADVLLSVMAVGSSASVWQLPVTSLPVSAGTGTYSADCGSCNCCWIDSFVDSSVNVRDSSPK